MPYRLPFALAAVKGRARFTRLPMVSLDCCFAAGVSWL
jgi:hypothetical protein